MSASTNQIPGYRGRQALSHQTPRLDTMRRLRDLADDLDELCMYITDTELLSAIWTQNIK